VLLKQVVSALEPIPEELQRAFEKSNRGLGDRRLVRSHPIELLAKSLSRLHRVFICVDALDEFPAKHRPELWESLQKVVLKCLNTRLFITGRFHIRDGVRKHLPSTARILPINSRTHDMGCVSS